METQRYLYETHMHTSEASACAGSTGAQMARAYKEAGYTGIIVTDHFFYGNTSVDRSAAYAARHIAKNLVAAGVADQILVELSYAIGIAEPLSIYVDTYNSPRPEALKGMTDGEIARRIGKLFDLRPAAIVKRFGLKNPIFEATASYGHFGNRPYTRTEKVWENGAEIEREIEFFGWEKLDAVEQIRKEFGL